MNAKENKGLALAAAAVILLGQPALARGGGFGGGFGGGYGGSHGFGAMGVHGLNGGYSPSTHGEGKSDFAEQGDRISNDRPVSNEAVNSGNHVSNIADSGNRNNDNITNNFNDNHNWAANHPYEGGRGSSTTRRTTTIRTAVTTTLPTLMDITAESEFFRKFRSSSTTQQPSNQYRRRSKTHPNSKSTTQCKTMQCSKQMMRERARVFARRTGRSDRTTCTTGSAWFK